MRVLLVEDDKTTARSIELALASEGIICDTAELGEEGLEVGKLYDYDLIKYRVIDVYNFLLKEFHCNFLKLILKLHNNQQLIDRLFFLIYIYNQIFLYFDQQQHP